MSIGLLALILVSVTFNALAQVALRKAMLAAAPMPPLSDPVTLALHLIGNLYLWVGLLCFGGSILLWLAVLARVPVSVAYPMASLGYIVAAGGGWLLLGETFSLMRIGGLLLICFGVFLVANSA